MAEVEDNYWEHYKLVFEAFNGEMNRFWLRFNVLTGLEVVAFYAFLKLDPLLTKEPLVFRFMLLFMVFFSILVFLIVWRAQDVYKILALLLVEIEEESEGKYFLISASKRLGEEHNIPSFKKPMAMYFASMISFIISIFWIFALLYVVMNPVNPIQKKVMIHEKISLNSVEIG